VTRKPKREAQPKYRVTMHRSPGLTEAERQRRIHQAFEYILSWPLPEEEPSEEEHNEHPT